MSNESEETFEVPPMHSLFADWLRPTDLGINRETLELRWAGIAQLRDELLDWELTQDIIKISLGIPPKISNSKERFKEIFKTHDNMFPMKQGGNEAELINLASACLAACLDDEGDEDFARKLSTLILATSFCGNRSFPEGPDLIVNSRQFALKEGSSQRKRINPPPVTLPYKVKDSTHDAIDAIQVNQVELIKTALQGVLGELTSHLKIAQNRVANHLKATNNQRKIQDEELEILWWVFGEKSQISGTSFPEIDPQAKPLILGTELSRRTAIEAELPSLKGLLAKTGVDHEGTIAFKALIDAAKNHSSSLLYEDEYCPTLTPTLHALSITRESKTWIKQWEKDSGLSANIKASPIEWAEQMYRENLFLKHWS